MTENNVEPFEIAIRENDMKAFLVINRPEDGFAYDKEEVLAALREKGVTTGINESKIAAMVKKHIYGREELVAEGKQPEHGEDGYFEYFFPTQKSKTPEIRPDGSVDYTSVNVIHCVTAGDKLAEYHPAIQGTPGVSIKGRPIAAKRSKELRPYFTTGCTYDPETLIYTADIDGKVELAKVRLSVIDLQEFTRDIDNVYGDIDFKGDVVIHGSVKPGVKITATKSVTVDGTLEAASISAGGDVIVKGGIMGNSISDIHCEGDFYADFIEYSNVWCKHSVSANVFWDCKVFAGDYVHATGKMGAIIGGSVYGMAGVDATFVGNDKEVKTVVSSGVKTEVSKRRKYVEKTILQLDDELDSIEEEMTEIQRSVRLGTADDLMQQQLLDLRKDKIQKKTERKEAEQKLTELDDVVGSAENAEIRIGDTAYPGSIFMLGEQQISIEEEKRQMKFLLDENENMVIKPLVKW
ncbi:MAG: FapA family protein [Lachnospiraceae bacterium]|nr:FapA family protein [Lachnospiraceae bacterium]